MLMTPFGPFSSNDEKTGFPPFGRVDTARYPASLLGKAVRIEPSPSLFSKQTVSTRERQASEVNLIFMHPFSAGSEATARSTVHFNDCAVYIGSVR